MIQVHGKVSTSVLGLGCFFAILGAVLIFMYINSIKARKIRDDNMYGGWNGRRAIFFSIIGIIIGFSFILGGIWLIIFYFGMRVWQL